jgi:hypothetical protein
MRTGWMTGTGVAIGIAVFVVFVYLIGRKAGRGHRPGSAAAGAVYDLLNEDKRRAIEIIVEQRAEATDPERARDNLPECEAPGGHTREPR